MLAPSWYVTRWSSGRMLSIDIEWPCLVIEKEDSLVFLVEAMHEWISSLDEEGSQGALNATRPVKGTEFLLISNGSLRIMRWATVR